jgi:hypothetical protein
MPEVTLSPHGALMRAFALDWLGCLDAAVPARILHPDYSVSIGGQTIAGRDAYVAATLGQYGRYLGLLLTVHDAIAAPGRTALRFTVHGAEPARAPVAWSGIALFRHDGRVLRSCCVEEDYLARRRQAEGGHCDPIESPMPAPWAVPELAADPSAEAAVTEWLTTGALSGGGRVVLDDGTSEPLVAGKAEVLELFSAGDAVAFAARQDGGYLGGLPDTDAGGQDASITVTGLVRVGADGLIGHVVRDRLGLRRRLLKATR